MGQKADFKSQCTLLFHQLYISTDARRSALVRTFSSIDFYDILAYPRCSNDEY